LIRATRFLDRLRDLPDVDLDVDGPSAGGWYDVDLTAGDWTLRVQLRPQEGVALSTPTPDDAFGGFDEIYEDADEALARVADLARRRAGTVPPMPVQLQRAREASGLTQDEVARALGVQQAAVSRLERRTNPQLESLERLVRAFGGELEVQVVVGGRAFPLRVGSPERKAG
jgi:DNA-binding XRE family transcriptional regulator